MLQLYTKEKTKLAGLLDYKNLTIEKELASGDKLLAFLYPKNSKFYFDIEEECYIKTKEDEFIVKEKNVQNEYTEFKCTLNLEDLEGKPWERYESVEQTIDKALSLALAGTGWIVGSCSLKKKRTVRISNCSSLEIIREIKKTYRCDLVFNTLTKTIDIYEHLGEDKGTYFIDSLNLKNLSIQGNSYDFFTRIIPIGKDNLRISSINNGKDYLENHQYSNKVKTCYWIDERYTIVENLKEDAESKLSEISKPYRSYCAEIINLAKLNNRYKNILDYKLGDTIYLISKDNKFRDKQRIVKIIEHPDEPELDSVEIANTSLSFEETQTQFQEAADTIENITTDNGTIDGSTVDSIKTEQISDFEASVAKITDLTVINAKITNLEAHNVTITGRLNAVEATIGTLEANVATIDKLTVTHTASINELQANKASITQLQATNATIQVLEANVGKIETLINGNLSSKNLQAGSITARELASDAIKAGSTVIGEGAIGNAQISNLDATKLNAGTIDTSLITIAGPNSNLRLSGNRLQVFVGIGSNQVERVSLGDVNGDGSVYGFRVRGADGKTILIDENGVKSEGITNGSITNDKINSNANIDGAKLNINSVVTKINGATTSILGTKIDINGTNLSLKLSQQDTTITEHKKTIDSHTTSIEANTNAIKLKVDNQTYITDKTNFTNTLNKATSDISLLQGQISLKVEQSDITNAIDNIEIGSANLVNNSAILQNLFSQINTYKGNRTVIDDNLALSNKCVKFECTNGGTGFHMPLFPKTTEKIGNIYTWSFWAKCSAVKSGNVGHESGGQKNITITTEWKRFDHTWKFTDSQYSSFTFYQGWNAGEILYIRDFQIVKGNKAGDWTPSITDIQNDIDTKVSTAKAEIKVTTDAIYQNISNLTTTVNTKADGSIVTSLNNKVSSLETSLNGIKGEVSSLETTTTTINNKVNQAQSDANINKNNILNLTTEVTTVKSNVAILDINLKGITQRVSSTETNITTVTATANDALSKANTATTKIDSLEIGGRNLLKDSKDSLSATSVSLKLVGSLTVDKSSLSGKTITISLDFDFEGLTSANGQSNRIGYEMGITFEDGSSFYISCWNYVSSSTKFKGRKSNTQIIPNKPIKNINYSGLYIQCNATRAYIGNPKLEFGNKNTDYTQAPEDFEYEITITNNKVASLETNLNSITSRVTSVETTTVNINGQISNLSTRMNTAEQKITDSSIVSTVTKSTTYKNDLNGKVSTSYVVSSINQSAEAIRINASKIDLQGAVSAGGISQGNFVKIEQENYTTYRNNKRTINIGTIQRFGYYLPCVYLGANGYSDTSTGLDGRYGALFHDGDNLILSHKNNKTGIWSSLKFYPYGDTMISTENAIVLSASAGIQFRDSLTCDVGSTYNIGSKNLPFKNAFMKRLAVLDFDTNNEGVVLESWGEQGRRLAVISAGNNDADLCFRTSYGDNRIFMDRYNGHFYPNKAASQDLGLSDRPWKTVFMQNAPSVMSDRRVKENIQYLDSTVISDMYDYVKNDLRLVKFNYIGNSKSTYGFIAQDIEFTKIGKEIVLRSEKGNLSYDMGARMAVLEGALKLAILKIESLEQQVNIKIAS